MSARPGSRMVRMARPPARRSRRADRLTELHHAAAPVAARPLHPNGCSAMAQNELVARTCCVFISGLFGGFAHDSSKRRQHWSQRCLFRPGQVLARCDYFDHGPTGIRETGRASVQFGRQPGRSQVFQPTGCPNRWLVPSPPVAGQPDTVIGGGASGPGMNSVR